MEIRLDCCLGTKMGYIVMQNLKTMSDKQPPLLVYVAYSIWTSEKVMPRSTIEYTV